MKLHLDITPNPMQEAAIKMWEYVWGVHTQRLRDVARAALIRQHLIQFRDSDVEDDGWEPTELDVLQFMDKMTTRPENVRDYQVFGLHMPQRSGLTVLLHLLINDHVYTQGLHSAEVVFIGSHPLENLFAAGNKWFDRVNQYIIRDAAPEEYEGVLRDLKRNSIKPTLVVVDGAGWIVHNDPHLMRLIDSVFDPQISLTQRIAYFTS